MPRDPNKAQQAREQRLAKQGDQPKEWYLHKVPGWVETAATWPLYEVLLSHNWMNTQNLTTALVARWSPTGQVGAASFVVDLACLGVKDVTVRLFKSLREYEERMREKAMEAQPMQPENADLVAKILDTAVAYARQFGFEPDPSYAQARWLLADTLPERHPAHVPVGGPDGKPHFIAGPYDNVKQVMDKLTRAVGPDGFHFTVPAEGFPEGWYIP